MSKEVYRAGRYSVKMSEPDHEGTVFLKFHVDGYDSPITEWVALMDPPPRPWYALLFEVVAFALGEHLPAKWNVMSYEEAIDRAIVQVERRRAADLKCIDYQRRIDAKLQDVAFREKAAAEVEAETVARQITDTTRESE